MIRGKEGKTKKKNKIMESVKSQIIINFNKNKEYIRH